MFKRCKKVCKGYNRGGKHRFLLFQDNFWPFPYHFMIISWPFLAISLLLYYRFLSFHIVPNYFPIVFDHFLSFLLISFSSLVIFCPSLLTLAISDHSCHFIVHLLTFIDIDWSFQTIFFVFLDSSLLFLDIE